MTPSPLLPKPYPTCSPNLHRNHQFVLSLQVLYENGALSVAYFFRFLAVGCVFLCINATLLYPDSTIPPSSEILTKKQIVTPNPYKKPKLTRFKDELQKYKLCLGQIINGREDASESEQASKQYNQLIPSNSNPQETTDLINSRVHVGSPRELSLPKNGSNVVPLIRVETVLDLSEVQNPVCNILGNCRDFKRVTYAECPKLSPCQNSKDNKQSSEDFELERPLIVDGQKGNSKCEHKEKRAVQKDCHVRGQEIRSKDVEKSCEVKDSLESR